MQFRDSPVTSNETNIAELFMINASRCDKWPECRQSCLEHGGQDGHVFDPIDIEAILEVDGVEVFENLGCS